MALVNADSHGAKVSPAPSPAVNISTIAADAGNVTGVTLEDIIPSLFKAEAAPRRRAALSRLSRRWFDATPWGTVVNVYPESTGSDTVTLNFNADMYYPGNSVRCEILSKHHCRHHELPEWVFLDGENRDTTVLDAYNDCVNYHGPEDLLQEVLTEASAIVAVTQPNLDSVVPPGFCHQDIASVKGDWWLVVATFEGDPGYAYAISRMDQPAVSETDNGMAVGAAILAVVITLLDMVIFELNGNHNEFQPNDAYLVKVYLSCISDLAEHGLRAILESGGLDGPKPTFEEIGNALNALGQGVVSGPDLLSRFLTTEHFHQQVQEDMDCDADGNHSP